MTEDVDQQEIEKRIEKLALEFSLKIPDRLLKIRQLIDELITANTGHHEILAEARRQAHSLGGTAGTFGFKKISFCLRELETLLSQPPQSFPGTVDGVYIDKIQEKLAAVDAAIRDVLP